MTLTARIKEIIRYCGISDMKFEAEIGLKRDRLTSVLRRDGDKYSSDILIAICQRYREINPSWLLVEEGEMILGESRSKATKIVTAPEAPPEQPEQTVESPGLYKQLCEDYRQQCQDKDSRIRDLENQLKEQAKAYNDTINQMQDRLDRKDQQKEDSEKEHLRTIRSLADKINRPQSSSTSGYDALKTPYGVAERRVKTS